MVVRRTSAPAVVVVLWKTILDCDKHNRKCDIHQLNVAHTIAHSKLSGKVVQHEIMKSVRDRLVVELNDETGGYFQLPSDELEYDDEYDWYCFSCHYGGDVKLCSTCWRVFHERCGKSSDSDQEGQFVCHICKRLSMSQDIIDMKKERLNIFLGFIINRLREQAEELYNFSSLELGANVKLLVHKPMDLDIVLEKVSAGNRYSNLQEFYEDILHLVHNVCILYGVSSEEAEMAKSSLHECEIEIENMLQCLDCYYYSNVKPKNWFSLPCRPPHDLVLARIHGYPFWPAKVLSHNSSKRLYTVRFFGGQHERSENLPESQIKPLVDNVVPSSPKFQGDLREAMIEVRLYKKLLLKSPTSPSSPLSPDAQGTSTGKMRLLIDYVITEGRDVLSPIKGVPIMETTTESGSVTKDVSLKNDEISTTDVKRLSSLKKINPELGVNSSSSCFLEKSSVSGPETGSSLSVQYKTTVDAVQENVGAKNMKITSKNGMTSMKAAESRDVLESLFKPDVIKSSEGAAEYGKQSVAKTPVNADGSMTGVNTQAVVYMNDSVTKQDKITSSGGRADNVKQSVSKTPNAVTRSRTSTTLSSSKARTKLSSLPVPERTDVVAMTSSSSAKKHTTIIPAGGKPLPSKRTLAFDAMMSSSNNRKISSASSDHDASFSGTRSKIAPSSMSSSFTSTSVATHGASNGFELLSCKKFDVKSTTSEQPFKKAKMTSDESSSLSKKVVVKNSDEHNGVGKDVKGRQAIQRNGQGVDEKRGALSPDAAASVGKCYSVTCRELFQKEIARLSSEFNAKINELNAKISDTKKRQWCRSCEEPSRYECCWNTSYCSKCCQSKDWPIHRQHHRPAV